MELCPTLEEFGDILGYDSDSLPMLPPTDPVNVPRDLASFLGILVGLASHFSHDGSVNLLTVIAFYKYPRDIRDRAYADARGAALVLCMISEFLLSSNSGVTVRICVLLRDCANPMGIVLAETFHGLDATAKNRAMLPLGSLFLFQAWLFEHFYFLQEPFGIPMTWHKRVISLPYDSFDDWMVWFNCLEEDNIQWFSPFRIS